MSTDTLSFSDAELSSINQADDLKIAPLRADGVNHGTPTWIWEVVVKGNLYVRAYHGIRSSWYQSAIKQKAGQIHAAGSLWEVSFEVVENEDLNRKIDEAYREKYANSPYLAAMIKDQAREATVKILPKSVE